MRKPGIEEFKYYVGIRSLAEFAQTLRRYTLQTG